MILIIFVNKQFFLFFLCFVRSYRNNPNSIEGGGGGEDRPCYAKIWQKVSVQNIKKILLTIGRSTQRQEVPHNIIKKYVIPIRLGLTNYAYRLHPFPFCVCCIQVLTEDIPSRRGGGSLSVHP